MDPALNENQPVFGVLVLPVLLKVLPDRHRLLDQMVQVLWDLAGEPLSTENSENLGAGDVSDLVDTVGVPEDNTNLGGGESFLGQLVDHLFNLISSQLLPLPRGIIMLLKQ